MSAGLQLSDERSEVDDRPRLFGLPDVLRAIGDGRSVWITRSKKQAIELAEMGAVATCPADEKGGWCDDYTSYFSNAHVVVLTEPTRPDRISGRQIALAIAATAKAVTVIEADEGVPTSDFVLTENEARGLKVLTSTDPSNPLAASHWEEFSNDDWQTWLPKLPDDEEAAVATECRPEEGLATVTPLVPEAASNELSTMKTSAALGLGPAERIRASVLTSKQLAALPPPTYLIDRFLLTSSLAVLWGPPGVMKSFVALDWALSIATGTYWQGQRVEKCPVLYVAAEGSSGLSQRQEAWSKENNVYDTSGVFWLPERVNLLESGNADALAEVVKEMSVGFVVIDTLNRSIPGGDENSSRDMGAAVEAADHVRRETGATVLFLHHATKSGETERGHGSLHGGVDTGIRAKGGTSAVTLSCQKQKDGAPFDDITLHAKDVGSSIVLTSRSSPVEDTDELSRAEVELLDGVNRYGSPEPIGSAALMKAMEWKESRFYATKSKLLDRGLIENVGTPKRPMFQPVVEVVET